MEFKTSEFYLKTEDEMREVFANYPEAIDNTQKIADMCNVDFEFGVRKLPRFDVPNNEIICIISEENAMRGFINTMARIPTKL